MNLHSHPHRPATPALVSRSGLRAYTSVTDMTLWRWIRAGTFPKPIYRNGRRYWLGHELGAWVTAQVESRTSKAA